MKIKKKTQTKAEISTASMPDIVFMLLIFFMVVTTFKQFDGLPVRIPSAESTQKIEVGKRDLAYIWVDKTNRRMLDDQFVAIEDLSGLIYTKRVANPKLVIALKADQKSHMKSVTDVQQELRKAYALRVNYTTLTK
ncbi:MAG: biopolymer transporter ExbD [Calditrichaeota bacterium]|nr:biopolymer transporter ExbD [Candidatus Cloacimonadota bacterium]MCA9787057.1 biopolymer transporter ExbD [Candidatus Cloacimonadota bacterium]MCB1046007.1 biopolymer transporter ExbD [Calditrichota bacterium]MCB9473109.1 biopolymer transporter ExbD [Candidatus Delongbacteria bacterium]